MHWMGLKASINDSDNRPNGYKNREIWWMNIGLNVGFEKDGKGDLYTRPVLVLRVFNRQLFWGVPLSSQHKDGKYYYTFEYGKYKSTALLSQMRAFDSKRLLRKFGEIDQEDYIHLISKMKKLL